MIGDLTTILGEAAAVVDPTGENEDISVLCGLVVWAVEHPDEYRGWDANTLATALRWNFDRDDENVQEMVRTLAPVWEERHTLTGEQSAHTRQRRHRRL